MSFRLLFSQIIAAPQNMAVLNAVTQIFSETLSFFSSRFFFENVERKSLPHKQQKYCIFWSYLTPDSIDDESQSLPTMQCQPGTQIRYTALPTKRYPDGASPRFGH